MLRPRRIYTFNPTEEECIDYISKKLRQEPDARDPIPEMDVYTMDAENIPIVPILQERCYYVRREKVSQNSNSSYAKRSREDIGTWRASTTAEVTDKRGQTIGYNKMLNFLRVKSINGKIITEKTNWIMHEYTTDKDTFQEYALCRITKTGRSSNEKNQEAAESQTTLEPTGKRKRTARSTTNKKKRPNISSMYASKASTATQPASYVMPADCFNTEETSNYMMVNSKNRFSNTEYKHVSDVNIYPVVNNQQQQHQDFPNFNEHQFYEQEPASYVMPADCFSTKETGNYMVVNSENRFSNTEYEHVSDVNIYPVVNNQQQQHQDFPNFNEHQLYEQERDNNIPQITTLSYDQGYPIDPPMGCSELQTFDMSDDIGSVNVNDLFSTEEEDQARQDQQQATAYDWFNNVPAEFTIDETRKADLNTTNQMNIDPTKQQFFVDSFSNQSIPLQYEQQQEGLDCFQCTPVAAETYPLQYEQQQEGLDCFQCTPIVAETYGWLEDMIRLNLQVTHVAKSLPDIHDLPTNSELTPTERRL